MNRRPLILIPLLLACGPFFYQAPPPLASYPERIPTKGWHHLLAESHPASGETADQLRAATSDLIRNLPSLAADQAHQQINTLLQRNRDGEFRILLANTLLELHELVDLPQPTRATYLSWKLARLDQLLPAAPRNSWETREQDFAKALAAHQQLILKTLAELDQQIDTAPLETQPHWLVQRAAIATLLGRNQPATADFARVAEQFPGHPRAEVASFMLGRSLLNQARALSRKTPTPTPEQLADIAQLRRDAADQLHNHLENHPDGRFTDDAIGWLGAIASDNQLHHESLDLQLQRLDLQPTREVVRSVLRECDHTFRLLFGSNDFSAEVRRLPYDDIARHPQAARLLVFHSLDPVDQEKFPILDLNRETDRPSLDFLRRSILRSNESTAFALEHLALATSRRSSTEPPLDPASYLVLGWAATRRGDHPQGLILIDRGLDLKPTDELLHARAIILARLERHPEALAAYQQLLSEFPASPLARASTFDLAIARFHAGQAGQSILALLELDGWFREHQQEWRDTHSTLENHHIQWIDAIARFAPIESLAAPLDQLEPDSPQAAILRTIVRSRALADENFILAAKHLDRPDDFQDPDYQPHVTTRWHPGYYRFIDQTRWQRVIAPLAALHRQIHSLGSNDPRLPALHLELARLWEKHRGQITLPFQQLFDYSGSETWKLDQLRRRNARFLGFSDPHATAHLDPQDELHHALRHYRNAARLSSDPSIAAPALEGANRALFRLAEFSRYAATRAIETDANALSRQLNQRLITDFPNRPEARRTPYWTFLPPDLLGAWMPGDYNMANSDARIALAINAEPSFSLFLNDRQPRDPMIGNTYADINDAVRLLPQRDLHPRDAHKLLRRLSKSFDTIRPDLTVEEILSLVDHLDDLIAASALPDITSEQFRNYATLRISGAPLPAITDQWKPFAPFIDFLNNRGTDLERAYATPEARQQFLLDWRSYLATYPDGPKSEAASLNLLRLEVRGSAPIPHVRAFHFPTAPIPHGYKHLRTTPNDLPAIDPHQLIEKIADHENRFPSGRYEADLAILRGAAEQLAGNQPAALDHFTRVLIDPKHPELRQDASLYFAELCLQLLDPIERPTLAQAFRRNPDALGLLNNLAHGDTCISRLRPLLPWLREPLR